jgi:hypothetical protein
MSTEYNTDEHSGASGSSTGFRCDVKDSHFGKWCDTGLSGALFVLFRGQHGWKSGPGSLEYLKLPGQIYVTDLQPLIDQYGTREIVAVDLKSGEWKTIWASTDAEVSCS